ncbi:hypothetical protein [Olleya sp. R77988]|uniref:hypothetical protein n=1 Tax=Olleya sp. R77988 TaxID=3093875 RepID=UPI0037C943EB
MNYTKEQIIEEVKQILEDLELDYYKDKEFNVHLNEEELKGFEKEHDFIKPWSCFVQTHDWQFDTDEGVYSFIIDNESPNKVLFIDGSGGQIPHSFIKKDANGKYYRDYIKK